jgi:tetratricopeptide (TPR) repeat protein
LSDEGGLSMTQTSRSTKPADDADVLTAARAALGRNDFPEAARLTDLALNSRETPLGRLLQGVARLKLGDTDGARAAFERAATLRPSAPEPLAGLGDVAEAKGEYDAMRSFYRRAMDANAERAPDYLHRYLQAGRTLHFTRSGRGERGFYRDATSLLDDVRECMTRGDLDYALGTLIDFGSRVLRQQLASPLLAHCDIAMGSAPLDRQIVELGAWAFARSGLRTPPERTKRVVYVATQLYTTGGHTRLLGNFASADPSREAVVLLTDLASERNRAAVEAMVPNARVEWCPRGTPSARIHWLMARLAELAPERVFLFQHHFDAIAVAACQPELAPDLYFMHHADYAFCYGVYMPHAVHIDGSVQDFNSCRGRLGNEHNLLLPYPSPDRGLNPAPLRSGPRALTTCTCTSASKLTRPGYALSYLDAFPGIFAHGVARHIHIGELPEELLKAILQRLDAHGISRDRFVYRGNVPSFWKALIDECVDVCIGSFPLGGGLTSTESMGSGTPYIAHANYLQAVLTDMDQLYPGAFAWRELSELYAALDHYASEGTEAHARAARTHFMAMHHEALLAEAFSGPRVRSVCAAPQRRQHHRDDLQVVLDSFHMPR